MNRSTFHASYCCAGFSLLDLLLAMTMISVGITGLMRYHQTLLFQFSYFTETRRAWRQASQLLDIYPAEWPLEDGGWRRLIQAGRATDECSIVKATVRSPKGIEAQLSRFICSYY